MTAPIVPLVLADTAPWGGLGWLKHLATPANKDGESRRGVGWVKVRAGGGCAHVGAGNVGVMRASKYGGAEACGVERVAG